MSDKPAPPPASVVTTLQVTHLTRAVTTKNEVRLELHVPETEKATQVAEWLRGELADRMPSLRGEPPERVRVNEDPDDKSKLVIVYRSDRARALKYDVDPIVASLRAVEIPLTDMIVESINEAFVARTELNERDQGSAFATEAKRRSAPKGHGGRGSR